MVWKTLVLASLAMVSTSVLAAQRPVSSAEGRARSRAAAEDARNAFGFEYGSVRSVDAADQGASYNAAGLRYARTLVERLLLDESGWRDGIAAEAGVFFYTITGFARLNDQVAVAPLEATLRYDVSYGRYLTFFGYSGAMRSFSDQSLLSNTRFALGLGAMLKLGSTWGLRAEYGTDMLALGAVVRL